MCKYDVVTIGEKNNHRVRWSYDLKRFYVFEFIAQRQSNKISWVAGLRKAGHQGFKKCNCKTGCGSKKCAFLVAMMLCNYKCHGSNQVTTTHK